MENSFNNINIETVSIDSELWEEYRGAYGNITDDLKILLDTSLEVPEYEKSLSFNYSGQEESEYMVAFDNICQQLGHQLSFYSALYLALPYLVKIYKYWSEKEDFKMQILLLTNIGNFVSTDIPYYHYNNDKDNVPKDIMDNYQKSILFFKEIAEDIFLHKLDKLKEYNYPHDDLSYICASLLALTGKREEAFILILGCWSQLSIFCKNCEYLDEATELEYDISDNLEATEGLKSIITPAASVIGQWDNKSLDDTYVWFSNVMHFLGNEKDVVKLSYLYGTYKCPDCGSIDGPVMDLCMCGLTEG